MDRNIISASIGISCLYHWGSSIGTVISWSTNKPRRRRMSGPWISGRPRASHPQLALRQRP